MLMTADYDDEWLSWLHSVQVLKRCQHLLMSPDARLRLSVLDTVSQCCLAMSSHYST